MIYLLKKEKNRIYKSESILEDCFSKKLFHDEHGAPYLEEGYISITDTKNFWACSFSSVPIGIDMEELTRKTSENIVKRLHKKEMEYLSVLSYGSSEWKEEFLSIWTKKESYCKYLGKGMSLGFKSFSVLEEDMDMLETSLFTKKLGSLVISSTEEIEVSKMSYLAPMNKTAKEAAADLLDISGYSSAKMKSKLLDKGYSSEEADDAVEILNEIGYLNDGEYARSIAIKCMKKGYSSKKIYFELKKKGLEDDLAKEESSKYKEDEYDRALYEAEKIITLKNADDKLLQKVARKLSSLGYDTYLIYDIIEKLKSINTR